MLALSLDLLVATVGQRTLWINAIGSAEERPSILNICLFGQLAGIIEGREWMHRASVRQGPLVASSSITLAHADKTVVERKERLMARYMRDTRLLERIQPYERSRSYYTTQGLDVEMMTAQAAAEEGRERTEDRTKDWWDLLSLETTATSADPQAAASNQGAADALEEGRTVAAEARVRKCSEAYRAYWRGLTVQQKAAEKAAAAAYVCEFVSAIVEGIRGEPPQQVGYTCS